MRWIVPNVLVLAMVAVAVSGCGSPDEPTAPCLGQAFDLKSGAEPLGSGKRLIEEFASAVHNEVESVAVGELTAKAGWSGEWDRAVQVSFLTTVESFNEKAGTHLAENCLLGIPSRFLTNDDAPTSNKFTVFIRGGEPVQAVDWQEPRPDLQMRVPFVTPDSELTYYASEYSMRTK
ncbi:hypothetical protein ACFC06_12440 [Nocardia sp. NPDC056064]|uniref:hypothetical protein n=1 Tax=Nocardia sp. NPDC056064 TaxID=3345701 RepID=UPI0035DF0B91